jgi:hypothetical protein
MDDTKRKQVRRQILELGQKVQNLAMARMGDTPAKRLAWLLRFMNTDLNLLHEEEQTALGYDLQALWLTAAHVPQKRDEAVRADPFRFQTMDQSELSGIQKWIKDGFATLFSEKSIWIFPAPVRVVLYRQSPPNAKRSDLALVTDFATKDLSWEKQRRLIEHAIMWVVFAGKDLLRACSECKSPFIPVRRQEYCSANCSQKARDRRRKKKRKTSGRRERGDRIMYVAGSGGTNNVEKSTRGNRHEKTKKRTDF